MERLESFSQGWFSKRCPLAWNPSPAPKLGERGCIHLGSALVLPPTGSLPGYPAGISNDWKFLVPGPALPDGQVGMSEGGSYGERGGPCV